MMEQRANAAISPGMSAVVKGLLDHAGIFPPTERTLDEAYEFAAKFRGEAGQSDLVAADMVFGVSLLETASVEKLNQLGWSADREFNIGLLASSELSGSGDEVLDDLKIINRFNQQHVDSSPRLAVTGYDIKLVEDVQNSLEQLTSLLKKIAADADPSVLISIEPNLAVENWQEVLTSTVNAISKLNAELGSERFGFKCRGTGPTGLGDKKDRLAEVIHYACAEKPVPLKATGGFHHPVAEFQDNGNPLGYLNVSVAVVGARAGQLSRTDILSLLNNTETSAFSFADGISFGNCSLSAEDAQAARDRLPFSVGCCNPGVPWKGLKESNLV